MDEIGCTTPFGVNLDHICNDLNKSIKAKKLYDLHRYRHRKINDCPFPCQFIRISLAPYSGRTDKNITKVKFDNFIKVTKAAYSYTELELLAELGGYVGLFLGLSVFDLRLVFIKISNIFMSN